MFKKLSTKLRLYTWKDLLKRSISGTMLLAVDCEGAPMSMLAVYWTVWHSALLRWPRDISFRSEEVLDFGDHE